MISTEHILGFTRKDLVARLEALGKVTVAQPLTCEFSISELEIQQEGNSHPVKRKIDAWLKGTEVDTKPAIYRIEANGPALADAMRDAFLALEGQPFKGPQRNKVREGSTVLYIGSSVRGVRARLKEHLRHVYKGTHALHLNRWIGTIDAAQKADGTLVVTVWAVNDPSELVLTQDLENSLWTHLQPVFGKRGGR